MTAEFWQAWGDGLAEVNTYSLTMPGGMRGTCVGITALEKISRSLRARAPGGSPAMRVSLLREYGTRRDMQSAWVWLEPFEKVADGMPAKIVSSSQDWDGQTWTQLVWSPDRIAATLHGFMDGDRQRSIAGNSDGVAQEVLLLASRRIAWPRLRLGQIYTAPVLGSAARERGALEWATVDLTLGKDRETVVVPAGRFRTNPFRAKWPDGFHHQFDVEADPPNRVVRWFSASGERAELTESKRVSLSAATRSRP